MKSLMRQRTRKIVGPELEAIVQRVCKVILQEMNPLKIILFGSAVHGDFDTYSDVDLVLVFASKEEANLGRKKYTQVRKHFDRNIEYLCVDLATFKDRSEEGGVYFVAKNEGRVLYGE